MEAYLLKSSVALIVLYVLYLLLLRIEPNHQLKRIVGLACVIFSTCFLLVPAETLPISGSYPPVVETVLEGSFYVQQSFSAVVSTSSFNIYLAVYFLGVGVLFIRTIVGLGTLISLYLQSEKYNQSGFKVVALKKGGSSFTFFNLLFLSRHDRENQNIDALISHEQLHRDQLHTIDVLILEALTIILWFNPAAWLFQRDIRAEHEYMADEKVLKMGFSKLDYQDFLFQNRTGVSFRSVNYLSNTTSLKKRFKMMENMKVNTKTNYFKVAAFLPLMMLVAMVTSMSPLITDAQNTDRTPDFKLYHGVENVDWNREVDLEKGVSPTTDYLFAMVPDTGDQLRVSLLYATYVSGGLGRGQMKSGGKISMKNFFSRVEAKDGDQIVIEIVQYQVKNNEGEIQTIDLEHPVIFNFPVAI